MTLLQRDREKYEEARIIFRADGNDKKGAGHVMR